MSHTRSDHDSAMLCVKCGYDLTGLPFPRCPECGRVAGNPLLNKSNDGVVPLWLACTLIALLMMGSVVGFLISKVGAIVTGVLALGLISIAAVGGTQEYHRARLYAVSRAAVLGTVLPFAVWFGASAAAIVGAVFFPLVVIGIYAMSESWPMRRRRPQRIVILLLILAVVTCITLIVGAAMLGAVGFAIWI